MSASILSALAAAVFPGLAWGRMNTKANINCQSLGGSSDVSFCSIKREAEITFALAL